MGNIYMVASLLCVAVITAQAAKVACGGGSTSSLRRRSSLVPAPAPVVPASPYVPNIIAAVDDQAFCMVHLGEVRCWGADDHNVLGYTHDQPSDYYSIYNSTVSIYSTNDFTCGADSDLENVPAVPFGADHSRAVEVVGSPSNGGACARFENGGIKCWGHNRFGALGQNTGTSTLPISDIATLPFIQFANGSSGRPTLAAQLVSSNRHRCILSTEHEVHCWGQNSYGVLGYGDTAPVGTFSKPVASAGAVPLWNSGVTKPVQIAVSDTNTCVLMDDGTMGCWGHSTYYRTGTCANSGSVGDAPNEVSAIMPLDFEAPAGVNVVSMHGSAIHMCAVLSDGTSTCWGFNSYGELGLDSSTTQKPVDSGRIAVTASGTAFQPLAG